MRASTKRRISFRANLAFQALLVFFTFLPFYFMILSSLKTNSQIASNYFGVTFPLHFENYARAFVRVVYYLGNSIFICGVASICVAILSCVTAYAFAVHQFPGKQFLFFFILSFLMIPGILTLIPQFVLIVRLGLIGSRWAAILPYIAYGQILFIFVLRTFIEGIPQDLFNSARIDGANAPLTFFNVVFPLARPILISLILLNFLGNWNDFIWPLLVLKGEKMKTVTVGLYAFTDAQQIQYGLLFAGFVLASLPLVLLFSFNMRYFIQGITSGAIKG